MLRTLFVVAIILFGLRMSLKGPFYGLLFYLWMAYFRPEYWLWYDFVSQLNLSLIIGIFVLATTVLSGRRLNLSGGAGLMLAMAAQSFVSVIFSSQFSYSFIYWQDFAKSTIISVLIATLVDTEKKLRATIVVIALSLGLEATKQGWGQLILNPGGLNDNPHAVLGDNNGVAVGMMMLVAILVALGRTTTTFKYEKHMWRFMAVGTVYRAISTYSRGGFIAAGAFGLHYLMRAKRKMPAIIGAVLVVVVIVPALPQKFWDRMNTIPRGTEEIEQSDYSTKGRVHFWFVAVDMANSRPLTGVGHNAYNLFYNEYDNSRGAYGGNRSVHSSWFGVLAELGYPGLIIFVSLILTVYSTCRRAQRLAKRHPELKDLGLYANGIESAMVAFAVGGSFVIFQYTELLWHTMAIAIVIGRLVKERAAALAEAPKPALAVPTPPPPFRMPVPQPARVAPVRRAQG